ncbi:MAG: Ribose import permease protein RbsC [Alphaproteobacteria bacterium MarineAlpha5_Bin5]|nr:MAG: Ribose import permease protein RbsC [Alphaproteobacteria bacterium MarineAlpha5_Bin5]PPR52801.1 MAG: Ribose import permease protein RbsC [Alphaproteobacteria bacterium MarineAlpha5_Bin4]|tara:strand:+ start:7123 stop:8058 length:936 start_codon:yes stop_codon:yes gene_type:complete
MNIIELSRKYGIAVITISLFLILALTTEGFFTERNIRNLLDQQSTILIAASFMTIVIISGNFDISISAIFVVAPLFALNIENATGNVLLSVFGGVGLGIILGAFNAIVVTYFKVNSFIATLATSFMFFGFGYLISDRSLMRPVTDTYQQIARTKFFDITSATWIALITVIIASILLTRTRFGRNVFATGGNQEAARLAGINVPMVQATTFILLGASAALAGIVNSSRSISAQPSDDFSFVFSVLTAVIVGGTSIMGGKGAIWRTVAAAFFLAFMNNGFNLLQVDPLWQRIILGLVIVIAVALDSWSQRKNV